ncbi:MAG: ribosomal-processing cysteine protease Prp [Lachnospiraceae bacterium]|jgi:uncharacterized protein YsxB (DUF464 family)
MIRVSIYKKSGLYEGFAVTGHSGYNEFGKDIICAAVSALVINTVNSIENFTEDAFELTSDEEQGMIEVRFKSEPGHDSRLLLDSMVQGLEGVRKESKDYIEIIYKEE